MYITPTVTRFSRAHRSCRHTGPSAFIQSRFFRAAATSYCSSVDRCGHVQVQSWRPSPGASPNLSDVHPRRHTQGLSTSTSVPSGRKGISSPAGSGRSPLFPWRPAICPSEIFRLGNTPEPAVDAGGSSSPFSLVNVYVNDDPVGSGDARDVSLCPGLFTEDGVEAVLRRSAGHLWGSLFRRECRPP